MPKRVTRLDKELRREFCNKVRPLIGKGQRFSTQAEAAANIGISPQRLNSYLKASATPSHHVLALVAERWEIQFEVSGTVLRPSQLRARRATTAAGPPPLQLNFFDKPQKLTNTEGNIVVRVERKGTTILGFSFEVDLAK